MENKISRRGFIAGALASVGAAGVDTGGILCQNVAANCAPLLRFGVVSDIHVRLAADGVTLAGGYGVETLEKAFAWFRDRGVDAVVIAGDMADNGLVRELKAVADAWFRIFPNDRAPDGRKVERVFTFGNHDAFGLKNGAAVFKDEAELRREAIQSDPARAWDACFHEEWRPFFRKSVNGFDFFGAHWEQGVWCNGFAETACAGCVEAFRAQMAKCDPSRPLFYVQHPHPRDTVYGKGAWGVDDGSATELLRAFPQAIAFSGHSHEPLSNDQSLWCGDYTSVATGSLRNVSASSIWNRVRTAGYENGICNYYLPEVRRKDRPASIAKYDAPKMMPVEAFQTNVRGGLLVSVYLDRIQFERQDFASGLSLGEDWVLALPARGRPFAERVSKSLAAEFPPDAALLARIGTGETRGMSSQGRKIVSEELPALLLEFPAACRGGVVTEYEIAVCGVGGEPYVTRICAKGSLYPRSHSNFAKPITAAIPASALPDGASSVQVTPLNAFGVPGRHIRTVI